jgi:hypothetical protein
LATNCQPRKIAGVSYWYLERNKTPTEQPLPDVEKSKQKILALAKKIKLAKQLQRFKCFKEDGCRACKPLEAIIKGEGKFVGSDEFNQDVYVIDKNGWEKQEEKSIVL